MKSLLNKLSLYFGLSIFYGVVLHAAVDADLSLSKSASAAVVNTSTSMSYTLIATNNDGATSAADVNITDTLPAGMSYVSSSSTSTSGSTGAWSCTAAGSPVVVTCTSTVLWKASSSTITLNVIAPDSNVSGTVTFTNNATITSTTADPNLANNSASATVTLNRNPTALDDSYVTTSHTNVSGNVLTNDSDIDGNSLSIVNPGTYTLNFGVITINSDGSFTYVPGYFSGEVDHYTYTVSDGQGGTATATLQISIGSSCTDTGLSNSERNFCLRKQTVLFGDMLTVGNTIIVPPTTQTSSICSSYTTGSYYTDSPSGEENNELYLCNYKPDSYTNATSAEVIIPAGGTIKWAGLYLQSLVRESDATSLSGMDVKIKNGNNSYVSVGTPSIINYNRYFYANSRYYDGYSAFVDVTSILKNNNWNGGVYTVANVPVTTDDFVGSNVQGKYGAWTLVVMYENPNESLKSFSVYDGWQQITGSQNATVTVNNFYTPTTGAIASKASVFVAEGDKYRTGDHFQVSNGASWVDLGNPTNNAFDSGIISTGTRTPSLNNNQGIDIKTYELGATGFNVLANSQNSISFQFPTSNDYYMPSMLSFSTEVYHPRMCYYEELYTSNGKLSPGDLVPKGTKIRARVLLKNDMNEPAEKVMLYRTFNSTMPYVANSTLLNDGSAAYPTLASTTFPVTDALDADVFDYSTPINLFSLHVGTGATYNQGGDFASGQTALFDYNITANFDGNTSIAYQIAYTMPTIGYKYEGELAKCEDFNNSFGVIPTTPVIGTMNVIEASSYSQAGSYAPANKNIFTKVVNKPFNLEAVYLDDLGNEKVYNGVIGNKIVNMAVTLYTTDTGSCTNQNQLIWTGQMADGTSHVTAHVDGAGLNPDTGEEGYLLTNAVKDQKIKAIFIDYATLINAATDLTCSTSSLDSALCLVPACLNSADQILKAFPLAKYPYVSTCIYGDGGGAAPCDSNAYNGSCGGKKTTISPSKYNHDTGCAACLADALDMNGCSTDNFSARPDRFIISSTNPDFFNLLRSAEDYNTSINAYDYGTTNHTLGYDVINANGVFNITTTKYNRNNIVDAAMAGTASFAATTFDMTNGISYKAGVAGSEVAGVTFDDVGKVNLRVEDRIWAAVDNDDTPMNCDANGTYICGDINVTFIPDHFDFNTLTITNNDGNPGIFTYLANELDQMAGRIDTTIRALNKDGNVTQNFATFPLYENNVTVIPVVRKSTYLYPDANETQITNLALNFASGVKTIVWSDTNSSRYLRFNFQRDIDKSVNPFDVNGSDLNISISSTYTDGANTATITGTRNMSADGKAIFLYGRTHAPRYRYPSNVGDALIYYEAYCDVDGNKTLLPNGINSIESVDELDWYQNENHNAAIDGNVGTIQQIKGLPYITATAATATVPVSTTLTYNEALGYPYISTMENNASMWLIYNKYNINATTNEFDVEFNKPASNWTGVRETNTTTDSDASKTTNKRIFW